MESSKIVKNTLALYLRMIVLTIISLFTYRVVFQCLGASDYGTYNVVGGFVSMFSFVSGTMTIASQRYFAVGLAKEDWDEVNKLFSVNIVIYVLTALLALALAETIGLWFVTTRLNLDYSQMEEIVIVYQTSVVIFLSGMMVSPFMALLVADENITIYSWISIIEGMLKIAVTYLLYVYNGKKLIAYSFLLLFVSLVINGVYIIYCFAKYRRLKFKICKDKKEYRTVFSFVNWNLIGAVAAVGKNQGINIIINIFFGTIINAARSIAYQLNSVISSFAQNFMKAIDPRIIKAYASGDETAFKSIINISSKISYYLLLVIAVPFIANSEYVLTLWLGEVPDYTIVFVSLALVDALILSLTDPILTAVQAIGKIKHYQLTVGVISLMNLPVAFVALKLDQNPIVPFIVAIALDAFITVGRLVNFKKLHSFSISQYLLEICFPAALITILSLVVSMTFLSSADNFILLVKNVIMIEVVVFSLIFVLGLKKDERTFVINFLKRR